jgi:hypothetical protein
MIKVIALFQCMNFTLLGCYRKDPDFLDETSIIQRGRNYLQLHLWRELWIGWGFVPAPDVGRCGCFLELPNLYVFCHVGNRTEFKMICKDGGERKCSLFFFSKRGRGFYKHHV